jgi:membrane-bound lytic murein transglycosylase MltF
MKYIYLIFLLFLVIPVYVQAPKRPYIAPQTVEARVLTTQEIIDLYTGESRLMERIAWCESQWDPTAKNPLSTASGLFQILDSTWKDFECTGDKLNSVDNSKCAERIRSLSGLNHWSESFFCWKNL